MKIDPARAREDLRKFDFAHLFREHLGWDNHRAALDIEVDGTPLHLEAVAEKRGFIAYVCRGPVPPRALRMKADRKVTQAAREHFVVYADQDAGRQVWHWVRREPGRPLAGRDLVFDVRQSGDTLLQRLDRIAVTLDEEGDTTIMAVAGGVRAAFDADRVTKRFYERFKTEHTALLGRITGIADAEDLKWYASVMLNRLMFVYFIQKKGFLDGDTDYLRNRMDRVRTAAGENRFQSFYRFFLLRLFHDGLGRAEADRHPDPVFAALLGKVPYLNGGFFEVHPLEARHPDLDIPDDAFTRLFDFFDQYRWHLDERPLRADNEINPDVVGYIFEKYINQKQMGAYYTKEDITGYITRNTVLPFLLDAARKKCAVAFDPGGALWGLLRDDPDRYIYPAVRHGVVREDGSVVPEEDLPDFVHTGMHDPRARMHDPRYNLRQAAADDPLRLVTETWREYAARRARCLELREKLRAGEVTSPNDLVTLNLDIAQFVQDAVDTCEGPDLLRAFWQVLAGHGDTPGLTVLDPTCGSGAFLFAALNLLRPLYEACLDRMEAFLVALDASLEKHSPKKYEDFRALLDRVAAHPSRPHFVLKSLLVHNLYGVDIMEEAVEICKLRLFLKLAAQVDDADRIEPLPDIDFNIRAGNTLVGFATLDEVRKSREGTLGLFDEEIRRIEEDAELADQAFHRFHQQQTGDGGPSDPEAKDEYRRRLDALNAQLDRFLAAEYGVNLTAKKAFPAWKASHQPFHWCVEFYGIMSRGGFDVIIGNPPYIEYAKIRKEYQIRGYSTEYCGNIYCFVMERSLTLIKSIGVLGMIVPMSLSSTARMSELRTEIMRRKTPVWISHFSGDAHPSKLFDGVKFRLDIVVIGAGKSSELWSSSYQKWFADARDSLFPKLTYDQVSSSIRHLQLIPKTGCSQSSDVLRKLLAKSFLANSLQDEAAAIYVHRVITMYVKCFDFVPFFRNETDGTKRSDDYKPFEFSKQATPLALATINSSTFFLYFVSFGDCFHCGKEYIHTFPAGLPTMDDAVCSGLRQLAEDLMSDLKKHAVRKVAKSEKTGMVEYDEFWPRYSKDIMDRIDLTLASHYGFTDEELDFIINYDIKYRMGRDAEEEGDDA